MTPTQITQLELDAAIADADASEKKSRAARASLEHQRSMLSSGVTAPPPTGGMSWIAVVFLVVLAFGFGMTMVQEDSKADGSALHSSYR